MALDEWWVSNQWQALAFARGPRARRRFTDIVRRETFVVLCCSVASARCTGCGSRSFGLWMVGVSGRPCAHSMRSSWETFRRKIGPLKVEGNENCLDISEEVVRRSLPPIRRVDEPIVDRRLSSSASSGRHISSRRSGGPLCFSPMRRAPEADRSCPATLTTCAHALI